MVLQVDIKKFFFDRSKVIDAMDKKVRAGLSKAGAFIRRSAKSLIRRRKRTSAPGSPPSSHTGLLRDFIYFGYDPHRRSVLVGPMKLNSGTDAPSTLEQGGYATIHRRNERTNKLESKRVKIAARPYMGPALKKNVSKLPEFMGPAAGGNFNAQ